MRDLLPFMKNVFPYILALASAGGCCLSAYRLSQKKEHALNEFNNAHNDEEEKSIVWYMNFLDRMINSQMIGMTVFIVVILTFSVPISNIVNVSAQVSYSILKDLIGLCGLLIWIIRMRKQKPIVKALYDDTRPPVLFLRSFDKDGEAPSTIFDSTSVNSKKIVTYEDMAIDLTQMIGPVIGIASPYRGVNDIVGASKGHFEDWQPAIHEFMKTASLIIMRPYDSEGVLWEFEQLVKHKYLYKTILYINLGGKENRKKRKAFNENQVAYENFRKMVLLNYNIELTHYNSKMPRIFFDKQNKANQTNDYFDIPIFRKIFYQQYLVAIKKGNLNV